MQITNNPKIEKIRQLEEPDIILGSGSMIPFNIADSGARKILAGTQREQLIQITEGEVSYIQTGTEQQFGEESSGFERATDDLVVVGKIDKFPTVPNHHYYLFLLNDDKKRIEVIERKSYKYVGETYGYLLDNEYLDSLKIGDEIRKGNVIRKTISYDKYNNRKDMLNPITAYMSLGQGIEDGIIISESFAKKATSPLFHYVPIIANGNDIPLNLFGTGDDYLVIPDICKDIPEGILMALRKENRDNALFAQDWNRLRDIMMSDDKFTTNGTIIDIDVRCNDPEGMRDNPYYSQITRYWDNSMTFARNVLNMVDGLADAGYEKSHQVKQIYYLCQEMLKGTQFIKDKVFSNVMVDIMVVEYNTLSISDKMCNRHGGKGVVVAIWPDWKMPLLENGQRVEVIFNYSTCVNRLNAGQMFEVEINHRSQRILEYMRQGTLSDRECARLYTDYISIGNEDVGQYLANYLALLDDESLNVYINRLKSMGGIHQSLRPISDNFTLDTLDQIDQKFPWTAKKYQVSVFLPDSNGNPRMVPAMNDIICGTEAVHRMKQYGEEKFSATSLSPTNIRKENTRSKANKVYKGIHGKTPIRFGDMEIGQMNNIGSDIVAIMLMIYSLCPDSRVTSGEQQLVGDPYNIDIKMDKESTNLKVEIINTKLKTIGLRLVFKKIPKNKKRGFIVTGFNVDNPRDRPIGFKIFDPDCNPEETLKKLWDLEHNPDGTLKRTNGFIKYGFTAGDEHLYKTGEVLQKLLQMNLPKFEEGDLDYE